MLYPPFLSVDRHGKGLPDVGMFDHPQVEPLPSPLRLEPPSVATAGSVPFQTVGTSSVSLNGTQDAIPLPSSVNPADLDRRKACSLLTLLPVFCVIWILSGASIVGRGIENRTVE